MSPHASSWIDRGVWGFRSNQKARKPEVECRGGRDAMGEVGRSASTAGMGVSFNPKNSFFEVRPDFEAGPIGRGCGGCWLVLRAVTRQERAGRGSQSRGERFDLGGRGENERGRASRTAARAAHLHTARGHRSRGSLARRQQQGQRRREGEPGKPKRSTRRSHDKSTEQRNAC